jgi:hypothetical protein
VRRAANRQLTATSPFAHIAGQPERQGQPEHRPAFHVTGHADIPAQASFHAWRPLFWIVAGIAVAGLLMSLLTVQDAPPADRNAPPDPAAIGLAAAGSVAAFWGAPELLTHRFGDPVAVVPLLGGLVLIIVLWGIPVLGQEPVADGTQPR